jgi:hypothetical protein
MQRTKLRTLAVAAALASAGLSACLVGCGDNRTPPPTRAAYEAGAPEALPCVPNLDGKIEASELTPQIGIPATYLVSPSGKERTVDVAGAPNAQGQLAWSLGVDFADDLALTVRASTVEGKWYAASFPQPGAFVAPFDAGGRVEGVYLHSPERLALLGLASVAPDVPEGRTLLVYGTPVELYRFPLAPGAEWTSVGEVRDATLRGLPYAGRDTYEVKVDGAGQLALPDFVLTQALRVRVKVTVAPAAGQTTTQRQTQFLFECLGEVARATSKLDEPQEDFTTALELRRLGLGP